VLVLASGTRLRVVGIVADVKQQGATGDPGQEILMPAATATRRSMTMVVRTSGRPDGMSQTIVNAIGAYDPNLAINHVRTMDAVVSEFLAPYRVEQTAMALFGAIAIVIAMMGLYAIMSFTVAARTREFGVRLALGASARSLLGLVLGQGLRIASVGVAIGLVGALATMRLLQSRLFGVAPNGSCHARRRRARHRRDRDHRRPHSGAASARGRRGHVAARRIAGTITLADRIAQATRAGHWQ